MTRPGAHFLIVVLLAGCLGIPPDPDSTGAAFSTIEQPPTPTPTRQSTATAALTPTPSPTPGIAVPTPGRPFDAATILETMRSSRRPGGVPDQLETSSIAGAIAERIWTFDGEPWALMAAGGSCGPVRCTLEIGGTHSGAPPEDLWTFEIIPESGELAVLSADLRSMPSAVAASLDELARAELPRIEAEELSLVTPRWLPPPDDGDFLLFYRSGNEEGSCELELRVSLPSGDVEVVEAIGC